MGEGFCRLMLAAIPNGAHVPKEVASRLGLWQEGHFETLLRRVEMQVAQKKGGKGKRKRKGAEQDAEAAARNQSILKMISEGAYRKAAMSILE